MYPVIHIYDVNYDNLEFSQLILPLILVASIASLFYLLLFLLKYIKVYCRNFILIIPIAIILLLNYGALFNFLIEKFDSRIIRNLYLIPIFLSILFLITYILSSLKKIFIIRMILFFLVTINLYSISSICFKFTLGSHNNQNISTDNFIKKSGESLNDPDIYFIILDMYPSNRVLNKFWNFDNTIFLSQLENIGFKIFSESMSNYPRTYLALNSILNYKYLDHLSPGKRQLLTENKLKENLLENETSIFLKNRGYNYYIFEGGIIPKPRIFTKNDFYLSYNNTPSKLDFRTTPDNDLFLFLINYSILQPIVDKFQALSSRIYRRRIRYVLQKLPELSMQLDKKFVLAHIMCPHSPYLFGKNGNEVFIDENSNMRKQAFLDQLIFINKNILPVIKKIVDTKNGREKIILLQGDHGTREIKPNNLYFKNENWVQAYYGNLNAIYVSDRIKYKEFTYVSPVNTFRQLFNIQFEKDFKLLEDRVFYTDYRFPLLFHEIN